MLGKAEAEALPGIHCTAVWNSIFLSHIMGLKWVVFCWFWIIIEITTGFCSALKIATHVKIAGCSHNYSKLATLMIIMIVYILLRVKYVYFIIVHMNVDHFGPFPWIHMLIHAEDILRENLLVAVLISWIIDYQHLFCCSSHRT